MESLLIFIAIFVIDALIKRANAKKKSPQPPPRHAAETDSTRELDKELSDEDFDEPADDQAPPEPKPSVARKLQEYIKQFEEAQREASQGTLEPAMPPPIPESTHNVGNNVTLREVAEDVILMDCIDIEYLMDEFEMSEGTAISMLSELQKHHIVGHDMGNGECDVLIHDEIELNNLLGREPNEVEASPTVESQPSSSDKQIQMKILEERARKAREEANEAARQSDIENGYTNATADESETRQRRAARSISKETVRRGFIWGKIIDEPRFKRRWTPAQR